MRRVSRAIWGEPAQEQAQVVAVCGLHRGRGVVGGDHCFFDDAGEKLEVGGACGEGLLVGLISRGFSCRLDEGACGGNMRDGQLVEANGDGLAQIHGGLAGIGGDFDEQVAEGKVFAGEAVLFRAEDEGDAAAAS